MAFADPWEGVCAAKSALSASPLNVGFPPEVSTAALDTAMATLRGR